MTDGQLNDALTDFLRALEVDPTYEAAQQEAQRTRALINGPNAPPPESDHSSVTSVRAQRDLQALGAPLQLKPLSDAPITIHMVADTKEIYRTIGKLAGINILFDPDYTSTSPHPRHHVTLADALRIFVSQTFWRPVTPVYDFCRGRYAHQTDGVGRSGGADVLPGKHHPGQ